MVSPAHGRAVQRGEMEVRQVAEERDFVERIDLGHEGYFVTSQGCKFNVSLIMKNISDFSGKTVGLLSFNADRGMPERKL
jgi:hypothetical protein